MRINHIIKESKNNILLTETRTYKLWESAGQKIAEANLTANQIDQLFQQIEKGATDAGGNRTVLGKGKDVASAVNKAWEDLKTKVQNSGPIKNVDAAYDQAAEKLKQATGGDDGVMKYVQKYRDFAKKHPIAQGLIYSALIAAAGISGAGLGGAAALGLFKMTDKLLQGQKFSSAAYSGAKTGAMAYAAGQIGRAMKGDHANAPQSTQASPKPSADHATSAAPKPSVDHATSAAPSADHATNATHAAPSADHASQTAHALAGNKDSAKMAKSAWEELQKQIDSGQVKTYSQAQRAMHKILDSDPNYKDASSAIKDAAKQRLEMTFDHSKVGDELFKNASNHATQAADHATNATQATDHATNATQATDHAKNATQAASHTAKTISGSIDTQNDPIYKAMLAQQQAQYPNAGLQFQRDMAGMQYRQYLATHSTSGADAIDLGQNVYKNGVTDAFKEVKAKFASGEIKDWNDYDNAMDDAISKVKFFNEFPEEGNAAKDALKLTFQKVVQNSGGDASGAGDGVVQAINQVIAKKAANESKQLSDSQISTLFYLSSVEHKLNEGVWDSVKGAVGKGLGKAATAVKTTGHNLTTKVTADKLMKAWKSAGSPTDSNEVAGFLASNGVSQEVIDKVFASMKLPQPKTGRQEPTVGDLDKMSNSKDKSSDKSDSKSSSKSPGKSSNSDLGLLINKLNKKEKTRLVTYLKRELGTA